jgi:hypothetical protein
MNEKVNNGIKLFEARGHKIDGCFLDNKPYYRIDGETLITAKELTELADGIYSVDELIKDILPRRGEK